MRFLKILGISSIMLFSFYYTDKISSYVLEKNDLYKEIEEKKDSYFVAAIPAQINGNYIVPGLNGIEVNVKNSFFNMKSTETFNENMLVYKEIIPTNSLEKNKDKIIKNGNKNKNSISFIIKNDKSLKEFFINNNINANILVNYNDFLNDSYLEQINNDINNYKNVEKLLNKYNLNTNICVINDNIKKICMKNEKYLVEPIILNNNNFFEIKNNLSNGDIIFIENNISIDNIKVLIDTAKFRDLKIVNLSQMIDEKRTLN